MTSPPQPRLPRKSGIAALITAALLCFASLAQASVVIETSVEEMTRVSALVLRGEVLLVEPHTVDGQATHIVTDVTVRVDELLKGSHEGRTLTFSLPGGKVGDYAMRIPGQPRFRAGEEVVLFLEPTRDGYTVCGMQQGKFTLLREPVSGARVALRAFDGGMALAHRDANGRLVLKHAEKDAAPMERLTDLLTRVHETVRVFGERPELPHNGVLPTRPRIEPSTP